MAVAGCNCNGNLGNSGIPGGLKAFGLTTGVFMVPLYGKDGTRNGLDLTSPTLGLGLLAMVNNQDPSKRAYSYQNLRNVTFEESDATFETADNGERFKTRDGIKTVTYAAWDVTNQYYNKVSGACREFGLYQVDVCGNLKGQKEGTMLYPRPVNRKSFDAKFIDATADTSTKVMFSMDYDFITNDGDQWMITKSELGGLSAQGLQGLIDVNFGITVNSATSLTVKAYFDYGTGVTQTPWLGATSADFTVRNVTTDSVITPSLVAENATVEGEYAFTIPAQTAADVVSLTAFKAGTALTVGYEGALTTFAAQ